MMLELVVVLPKAVEAKGSSKPNSPSGLAPSVLAACGRCASSGSSGRGSSSILGIGPHRGSENPTLIPKC